MANRKISELTAAGALTGAELVEVVQGGVNKQTTTQDIADLGGGGGGAVDSVNGATGTVVLDAGDIGFTPTGGLASTDLQAALAELDSEKLNASAVPVKADQSEANEGTNDTDFITPLKAHVKNRKSAAPTTNTTIDQEDHDQAVIFSNSATAINYEFPVLAAGTYLTIVQVNDGDITWTNSGGTTFEGASTSITGGDVGTSVTFYYRTTTEIVVISGDVATLSGLSINGALALKAGSSSGVIGAVGGVIHTDTTTTGNVGTGEDTLFTYTVLAQTLASNGDSLVGFAVGTFAANGNNKNVRVKFGATTIFAMGATAANAGDWRIDFHIIRTGATTQKCSARYTSSNTTLDETFDYTTAAETMSGPIALVVTGEATSNNDIVGEMFKVTWEPA